MHVFKTVADPFVGQVALFQVLSGTVRPDDHLVNPRTGADERLHGLFTLRGKEHVEVTDVPAGDIAAVAKLSRHRHRRHPRPQGHPGPVPAAAVPDPVALGGGRGRRRRPTRTSWPPPCTGWSRTTRRW